MSERFVVLGAGGMLGRSVESVARETGASISRVLRVPDGRPAAVLDLRRTHEVTSLLEARRPDVVVNCAGVVPQRQATAADMIALNALLPHVIAESLDRYGGRLLQVSTDCVFSGTRGCYSERDSPDPVDVYGHSKVLGEVDHPPHLTVRTSFVGFDAGAPRGLLSWLASRKGTVKGFRNALWSGVTSDTLAKILLELATAAPVTGVLHVAGETIDKCALLELLCDVFALDLRVEPADEPRIDRTLTSVREDAPNVPSLRDQLLGLRERALRERWWGTT